MDSRISVEALRTEAKLSVNAVLTSSASVLSLNDLIRDYKELNGSDIPFRKLGFSNLLDFLRSIPDTVRLSNPESPSTLIFPVGDKDTAHIAKLVHGQKTNTKSRKSSRAPFRAPRPSFNNFCRRPFIPRRNESTFIPQDFTKDILKYVEEESGKPGGLSLDVYHYKISHVSYNYALTNPVEELRANFESFIDVRNNKVYLKNKNPPAVRGPPEYFSKRKDLDFSSEDDEDDTFDMGSENSCGSDESIHENRCHTQSSLTNGNSYTRSDPDIISDMLIEKIHPRVIKNITTLIEEPENRNGIWVYDFASKYLVKFNCRIEPKEYGFTDILDLLGHLKHVVRLKRFRSEGDYLVTDARQTEAPVECEETGDIPISFINTLKKILMKRPAGSLCTNDLPAEYKRQCGRTLDVKEFGFDSMDSFLKNLEEFHSDFRFIRVKDKILIRLDTKPEVLSNRSMNLADNLPKGQIFNPFPSEVCDTEVELPPDPLFESLERGDVFPAAMAEVYTPWKFFLHHFENVDTLNRMMDDLNVFYIENQREYEMLPTLVTKGLLCSCQYKADGRWHRAKVINTKLKTAKIKFVDYGTEDEVNVSELRYLHREFAKHHVMSVRAKLSGVQHKNIADPDKKKKHSTEGNHYFFHLCATGGLEAKIVDINNKIDCYEVMLRCTDDEGGVVNIAQRLISDNYADKKVDEFAEDSISESVELSLVNGNESQPPAQKTEKKLPTNPQNGATNEKPKSTAPTPSMAPAPSQPPTQTSSQQKAPPPGLSLPPNKSQNSNTPLFQKSKEASSGGGSKKKSKQNKPQNTNLYGTPLIAQMPLNSPMFNATHMNVPQSYMTPLSLSNASSVDSLLQMTQGMRPPFGIGPPSMGTSYTSPAPSFMQYPPPPYMVNYPPFSMNAMHPRPGPLPPSHFPVQPHPASVIRPPPGFSPLPAFAASPSAPPSTQSRFVPTPPATPYRVPVECDNTTSAYTNGTLHEPLVTTATSAASTTSRAKFEWPITDPELATQWEMKRKETPESAGCGKQENKETLSRLQQEDAAQSSADAATKEELMATEKARERRAVESTLKKYFTLSPEIAGSVRNLLEARVKWQSADGGAGDAPSAETTASAAAVSPEPPSETGFWDPPPSRVHQPTDAASTVTAIFERLLEESEARNEAPPAVANFDSPAAANFGSSAAANLGSPSVTTTTASPENTAAAPSKASKLNRVRQFVMQHKK